MVGHSDSWIRTFMVIYLEGVASISNKSADCSKTKIPFSRAVNYVLNLNSSDRLTALCVAVFQFNTLFKSLGIPIPRSGLMALCW